MYIARIKKETLFLNLLCMEKVHCLFSLKLAKPPFSIQIPSFIWQINYLDGTNVQAQVASAVVRSEAMFLLLIPKENKLM